MRLHPCHVCGGMTQYYPGSVCSDCNTANRSKYRDWRASYRANTARHEAQRHQAEETGTNG